jgi:hypothetical protein
MKAAQVFISLMAFFVLTRLVYQLLFPWNLKLSSKITFFPNQDLDGLSKKNQVLCVQIEFYYMTSVNENIRFRLAITPVASQKQ